MTTQELNKKIDSVLGNSVRCVLPSYWWRRLFHDVVDTIEGEGIPIVGSEGELDSLQLEKGKVASVVSEGEWKSVRECYQPTEGDRGSMAAMSSFTRITKFKVAPPPADLNIGVFLGDVNTLTLAIIGSEEGSIFAATFNIATETGSEFIIYENGVLNTAALNMFNSVLASGRFLYFGKALEGAEQFTEEEFAMLDTFLSWGGPTCDLYIKGEAWERLAKGSEIPVINTSQIITVDSALSTTSENPVQNKVITTELDKKGTVKKVKINGSEKSPDTNGVVDLGTITSGSEAPSFVGDEVYIDVTNNTVSLIVDTQGGGLGVREGSQGLGIIDIPEDAMGNVEKYVGEREAYLEGYAEDLVIDLGNDIKANPSTYIPLKTVNGNSLYGIGNIVISGDGTSSDTGNSEKELREIYVGNTLTDEQKTYNAETYTKLSSNAGVMPYIKGGNNTPRYLKNFTVWNAATPYITMRDYILDGLTSGTYTYLVVTLYSDGSASSASTDAAIPSLDVDTALSKDSTKPVQNKAIWSAWNEVAEWCTRLQNVNNNQTESINTLKGYFTDGAANNAKIAEDSDKLDGHDSAYFATSESVTSLDTKVEGMKVKVISDSAITQLAMSPNTLYKLSNITNLTITFTAGETDVANYYMLELAIGSTIPTITLPSGVKWMDGYNVLTHLEANSVCQVSILNNLAVGGVFV